MLLRVQQNTYVLLGVDADFIKTTKLLVFYVTYLMKIGTIVPPGC